MLFGKPKLNECPSCRIALVRGGTTDLVGSSGPRLTVKGVPAWDCPGCGNIQASAAADTFVRELSSHFRATSAGADALIVNLSPTPPPAGPDAESGEMPLYNRLAFAENVDRLDDLLLSTDLRDRLLDFVHGVSAQTRIQAVLGPRLGRDATRSILNLWGPPGTGKSTIARALAHALSRDLFVLNAAGLESSKVGETEKNIVRLFQSVRDADAVLLIDEADSLVDARTRAQSGHEKSINQARNVLINQLNSFKGVAIFASNLRENYDPALARRMEELHVPPPGEDQLSRLITAALTQMRLKGPASEDWVSGLVRRIARHERLRGDPARPFTAADINAVLLRAARTASRRRPEDGRPLALERREIEAALERHCEQLAAAHKPNAENVRHAAMREASGVLSELVASHVLRHTQANASRPSPEMRDSKYRPAAEVTMTDALTHVELLIADLKRVAAMVAPVDAADLPRILRSFLGTAAPYSGSTNQA